MAEGAPAHARGGCFVGHFRYCRSPGGGIPDKPVGTVWMAVCDGQRCVVAKHIRTGPGQKHPIDRGICLEHGSKVFTGGDLTPEPFRAKTEYSFLKAIGPKSVLYNCTGYY